MNNPEGREAVARRPLHGVDLSVLDSELQAGGVGLSGVDGQPLTVDSVASDLCDRVEAGYRDALTAMTENRGAPHLLSVCAACLDPLFCTTAGDMWALYIKWQMEKLPWQQSTDVS